MANPIFDTDPHAVYGNLKAWITDPPGMVNRLADGARVTAKVALDMTIEVDRAMRARWPRTKYTYVHDFSGGVGYDEEAVKILFDWGHKSMADVRAIIVVVSPYHTDLERVGVYVGKMALGIFGVPMDISESLEDTIARFKLRPASL